MNKRQAKKELKKAVNAILHGRKNGISVSIQTHGVIDENGKECDPMTTIGARYIQFKKPKIKYHKH